MNIATINDDQGQFHSDHNFNHGPRSGIQLGQWSSTKLG
jgi:hypothetical protein